MRTKLVLAALAAATLATGAGAQTITNGSFENGTAPGSFLTVNTGDTAITGWTVTNGSVDYIGSYFPAQDGSRSVDLSGDGPGTLSQLITGLTVGTAYNVSFYLGGNFDGPPPTKTVAVSAGTTSQNFTYVPPAGAPGNFSGYTRYNFGFTALDASTTLSFASLTGTAYGPVLDNVSIAAVPEPASWAMMIGGFGLVGYAMRRRRKAAGVTFA